MTTAEQTNRKPKCPNCKRYIPADAETCPVCGQPTGN